MNDEDSGHGRFIKLGDEDIVRIMDGLNALYIVRQTDRAQTEWDRAHFLIDNELNQIVKLQNYLKENLPAGERQDVL